MEDFIHVHIQSKKRNENSSLTIHNAPCVNDQLNNTNAIVIIVGMKTR